MSISSSVVSTPSSGWELGILYRMRGWRTERRRPGLRPQARLRLGFPRGAGTESYRVFSGSHRVSRWTRQQICTLVTDGDGLRQIRVTWPTRRQQSATCPSQHTKLMNRNQKPVKSAWGSTWTCIWWTSWSDADEQICTCTNLRFRSARPRPRLRYGAGAWGT